MLNYNSIFNNKLSNLETVILKIFSTLILADFIINGKQNGFN